MADTRGSEDLTLLILAGGAGRRMGGADKPLMAWRGEPMIDRVRARCPRDATVLVSANRNAGAYATRGRVISDDDVRALAPELKVGGPLLGVLGGLFTATTQWLLVVPGDSPNLPPTWAEQMLAARTDESEAVVAHDGQRQQHLHLLLHRSTREGLRAHLAAGRHEVYLWLQTLRLSTCDFAGDDTGDFSNVNTEEDLGAKS